MTAKILISKEKLIELYIKRKLSTHQIGKIIGCDPSVIQKRLKEFRITLRQPKKKIIIQKRELERLYLNKGFSTQKISNLLGISSCSVYYKLKEFNIKTRKKRIFKINKNKLENLYLKKRISCSQIAKKKGFTTTVVWNKLKKYSIKTRDYLEANIKYPKKIFDGDNELKAYMIGFRLGDLNVESIRNESTVIVKSSTTKECQVRLIKEVYGGYGHFWIKKYGDVFSTMTFLDKSFNFLVKKEDNIADWIREKNKLFIAFLGGYTDAEGCISISQGRARFRIRSYDKNILSQIHIKLNSLGINTKFGLASKKGVHSGAKHNQDCWGVFVYTKNDLLNLFSLIKPHMKHEKRLSDIILAENNILERNKKHIKAVMI